MFLVDTKQKNLEQCGPFPWNSPINSQQRYYKKAPWKPQPLTSWAPKTSYKLGLELQPHLPIDFRPFIWNTPRKFNIDPENRPSQKETHLPTIIFQGLC